MPNVKKQMSQNLVGFSSVRTLSVLTQGNATIQIATRRNKSALE